MLKYTLNLDALWRAELSTGHGFFYWTFKNTDLTTGAAPVGDDVHRDPETRCIWKSGFVIVWPLWSKTNKQGFCGNLGREVMPLPLKRWPPLQYWLSKATRDGDLRIVLSGSLILPPLGRHTLSNQYFRCPESFLWLKSSWSSGRWVLFVVGAKSRICFRGLCSGHFYWCVSLISVLDQRAAGLVHNSTSSVLSVPLFFLQIFGNNVRFLCTNHYEVVKIVLWKLCSSLLFDLPDSRLRDAKV